MAGRRITLAGHSPRLDEFVHEALLAWLLQRQATWPHTPNRQVVVSAVTATGTAPISDYYPSWHLLLRGVALEQIRGDRVLPEALAVRADPLHLAAMFHLTTATTIAYADIAHSLLERPVESSGIDHDSRAAEDPNAHAIPRPGSLGEPAGITIVGAGNAVGSF